MLFNRRLLQHECHHGCSIRWVWVHTPPGGGERLKPQHASQQTRFTINEITLVRGESAQAEGFSGRAEWMWSIGAVPGHRPRAGWWTINDRRNSSQLCNLNKKRPKRIMVEILAPGAANVKLNNNRILRLQSLERLVCARARKQVKQPNWMLDAAPSSFAG